MSNPRVPDQVLDLPEKFSMIEGTEVRRLVHWWLGLSGNDAIPPRTKLDPTDIPWALSRIWLVRRDRDSGRFSYVIAGEQVQDAWSVTLIGKAIEDIFPDRIIPIVNEKFSRICDTPAVIYDCGPIYIKADRSSYGERIHLPMLGENGDPEFIIGYTAYLREKPASSEVTSTFTIPLG